MTEPRGSISMERVPSTVRRVGRETAGEGHHHFFGYYNKSNWHPGDPLLLSHRVSMMTGDLKGGERAEVGFFDLSRNDVFRSIGVTTAWNWQMGAQLQWLEHRGKPADAGHEIIFNTRVSDIASPVFSGGAARPAGHRKSFYPEFRSVIHDVESDERRVLPLPIYVAAPSSEYAICVDYSRFQVTHRTIGYASTGAEPKLDPAPADDGIRRMDLRNGDSELILSLKDLKNHEPRKSMEGAVHWVTHLEVSPDSSRILFIHRWTERVEDEMCFLHRLYTMNPDGSDLYLLECSDHPVPQLSEDFDPNASGVFDYEKSPYQISHPAWKDNGHIIVWGPHNGRIAYHLYTDRGSTVEVVGEGILVENGHMTYRPNDSRRLLTDTYPDPISNERLLMLFHTRRKVCRVLGSFYTPPNLGKENRCDLHPRWNHEGSALSIDSVHEGSRQQYIVDAGRAVE